jgi:hypothetical protein
LENNIKYLVHENKAKDERIRVLEEEVQCSKRNRESIKELGYAPRKLG